VDPLTDATTRNLKLGGLLAWILAGAPVLFGEKPDPAAFRLWLLAFGTFGLSFALVMARSVQARSVRYGLLALQSACVAAMALLMCFGFEGLLLTAVAVQLGLLAPRRAGLIWVVAQSLLLGWAIREHWAIRAALLLIPPYLGVQLLALLSLQSLAKEAQARCALQLANGELRATREILADSARAGERLRIARDLHDAIGHHLVVLSLQLEALSSCAVADGGETTRGGLRAARATAKMLLNDVEDVVRSLNQSEIDLDRALRALAEEVPRPRIHLDIACRVEDSDRAHALLRCSQETVTNAVKHSGAENLWIRIDQDGERIRFHARDDGTCAGSLEPGHGLRGMSDRLHALGGTLELRAAPGTGLELLATLPAVRAP